MANENKTTTRYTETIAILAVLLQIRDGHGKSPTTDDDIAAAENLLQRVRGEIDEA
jgi:hypothetical protein